MHLEERVYKMTPASSSTSIFIACFIVVILAVLIVTSYSGEMELLSAPGIVLWVVLLAVAALFIYMGYQAKRITFSITEAGLRIGPGLYRRTISRDRIDIARAMVINLDTDKEYRPKWRTNGAGFPGFLLGWFRLYNKEKALLFLTDRSSVVYFRTKDNYSVLLSAPDADEIVDAIKSWSRSGRYGAA